MKHLFYCALLSLCTILLPHQSQSQGKLTFTQTVYKQDGRPYANCPIVIIETSTFQRKEFKTNSSGQLHLELNEGEEWAMNIGEMRNHTFLNVPPGGESTGSSTTTYDVARWNRLNAPLKDRSLYSLEEEIVRLPENARPDANHEIFEVYVVSEKGKPYQGMEVKLTSFELGKSYVCNTDHNGISRFKLPFNTKFQIDLDGEIDFEYHDTGNKPYKRRVTLTYEKIRFKEEENQEGYIEQTFLEDPRPISSRVFVAMNVVGGPNNGANEDIYLQMAYSQKKYHAKTNEEGRAYFLLPKKREYSVSFDFQKGAGVVDLKRFYGIGSMSTTMYYEPEERLQYPERFLPTKNEVPQWDINNFHKRKYPKNNENELINVHVKWGNNKINSGAKEALLELGFSVNEPKEKKAVQSPLNIAFVLDKSGSMSGENIDLLKKGMFDFIEKLRPADKVSLIFFDTEAVVAYPSQVANKTILKDIVGACKANGGTSIYNGLELGFKEVNKNKTSNSVDRLILLTDGFGSKPVDDVIALAKQYYEKGIAVSTIGVGEDYNSALLSMLSKYSGGLEHQAIESEGISEALDKEFESLLYPLASDLKVKVKYNNRVIYKSLYGVPETKNSDGMVQFDLEKVYSSLNRMVLMKFKIENPDRDINKNKISIEVSYHDEIKNEDVKTVEETYLEWSDESDIEMIHDAEIRNTYSVAVINQMMKVLADQCDSKDYIAARKTINETLKSIKKINREKFSAELIPIIEQLNTYLSGIEQAYKNMN